MDAKVLAENNKIYEVISGSHAYGLATETSDVDTRGLFIAPKKIILSPFHNIEQYMGEDNDLQIYELKKFFHLLAANNPNIVELLFIPDKWVKFKHPMMEKILTERNRFLSKKCRYTFSGYAISQLKRIKGHNKWIANPQSEEPPYLGDYVRVVDYYGIEVAPELTQEYLSRYTPTKVNEHNYKLWEIASDAFPEGFLRDRKQNSPNYIDIDMQKLKVDKAEYKGMAIISWEAYKEALKKWQDYWSWKKNRNEKRAELEAVSGFDTKHGMHLVRLLRLGKEILTTGQVLVERPDAEELRSIRNGAWSYEQVVEYAERADAEMNELYEKSALPDCVDINWARDLYIEMVEEYWNGSR